MLATCVGCDHAHNIFNLERHLIFRRTLRLFRAAAAEQWQNATAAA